MTALELVKSRDTMAALILFIRSEEAQRILSAWPMMEIEFADRPLKKNEDFRDAHDNLWLEAKYDLAALAYQADIPQTRSDKMFARLMKANLVYPDGTISPNATNLLVTRAMADVKKQGPRGRLYEGSRINPAGESVPKPDNGGLPTGRAAEPRKDPIRRAPARKPGAKAR